MQIELSDNDLLLISLTRKANERLSEYIINHPAADENDYVYAGRLDTVRFFQAQLAESLLNHVTDEKSEPNADQAA